jgi:tight adherence protein B
MTWAVVMLLALVLVLIRPPSPVTARLRALGIGLRISSWPALPDIRTGLALAAIGGGVLLGGLARWGFGAAVPVLPATAGAIAAGTAAAVGFRAAADHERRRVDATVAGSVGALAADLRAGQQPGQALAALGTDPATQHPAVRAVWTVAERSGAPAAAVLDRVEQDLLSRGAQRREIAAALAGARSSGTLLAVLPLLGIALGAAMGAHPLTVLLAEPRGQLALVVGVTLETVGVLWTARIVKAAEEAS